MRKSIFTLLMFACAAARIYSQPAPAPDKKTLAVLQTFRSDYIRTMLDKQTERLLPYYSEDARLMPEFQKTVRSKNNVALYHRAFLLRFDVTRYTRTEKETLDLGTRVLETGLFTAGLKVKSTGKEHTLNGKYFVVWSKSPAGALSLVSEAWNYDHALDIEDQLRFADVPVTDVALMPHLPVNSPILFELAALNRLMEVTVSQMDGALWSQFYTPDGMFCYSRHPMCVGKKELDAFFEDHCKHLPVFEKLDIRNDAVEPLGKYVLEYASHIAIWRGGEYSGVGLGKDIRLWRREADGTLKIFRHIALYD